ncbi:hypothetical protein ABEP42_01325 [Priestia megaterium]
MKKKNDKSHHKKCKNNHSGRGNDSVKNEKNCNKPPDKMYFT